MGGGKRSGEAKVDDSVPFAFLIGDKYSGYKQAINSSKDLKPMPSKLPKLFWGLSNEQRRLLAARMLEAGHSGAELERAIRLALWGEDSSRRNVRVPSRLQPWDNAHKVEGGLNGVGLDGRPVVPERFRPREPFLVVEAEEVHTFGAGGRVEKPHERSDCGPAKRRREIQEMMRARVQVQEDFLVGLELDRREWRRHQTRAAKSGVVAPQHRRRQLRLAYGSDPSDGVGSDITSCVPEFDDARREKQEVARVLKAARQAELKANVESATMRRWEKEVLKTIRAEAANALRTPGTSIGGREPELTRALYQLSAEHSCAGEDRAPSCETAGERLEDWGAEEEVALAAAQERGERVARAQEQPATRAREDPGGGRGQPAAVDGDAGATPRQQRPAAPERTGEAGVNAEMPAVAVAAAGAGITGCADVVAAASDISEEDNRTGEEKQGGDAIANMLEKLLRTSNSVVHAVATPLSVKPPPVLEVEQDPRQAKLASQIRSRKQKRFPPAQRAPSARAFIGGGYRTNSGGGGGGGGGRGGDGRAGGRSADATALSSPDGGGGGVCVGKNLEATRSSSCPALATAPAGVLDLEAITAAASRLNGSGGGGSGSGSGSGGSGVLYPENLAHHHPRNRFAPMAESEVKRFLLQSWRNDYVFPGMGYGDIGGKGASGWDTSIGCDAGRTAVSSLFTQSCSAPPRTQLRVVGTSTTRQNGGRALNAGSASAGGVPPRSPRASTSLEGWATNQTATTEIQR